ncbi:MAG: hypothetical protein MZW92_13750 [Comamonadaceae bacterium]|nr:hypothetical protein [Comamonadaceae bacterium]
MRDFLGIDPGSKVTFELTPRGEVVLRPLRAKSGRRSRLRQGPLQRNGQDAH